MDKKEWMEDFGRSLREFIAEEGITQKQLAEESGVAETDISKYIAGTRAPSIRSIVNIAYALNRTADELINADEMID